MADIYVATTGNDTTGDGSAGNPYATWNHGASLLSPGDTLLIQPGTYVAAAAVWGMLQYNSGTVNARITIKGDGGVPILNCANVIDSSGHSPKGLYISGNYITVQDVRVTGVIQRSSADFVTGILLLNGGAGATGIILRRVESDHNMGSGMIVAGDGITNLLVEDCDFHHNYDELSTNVGDNADGVSCNSSSSVGIHFNRCRFWWNTDDGLDLYTAAQPVTVTNCWSFWNGYQPGTFTPTAGGDGEGFKLGFTGIAGAQHIVTNNMAVENRLSGFSDNGGNQGISGMYWYNNTSINNGEFGFLTWWDDSSQILRNNLSLGDVLLGDLGSNVPSATDDDQYNSWNTPPGITVTSADFQSVDSTGMDGARRSGGRLPLLAIGRLVASSDAIDAGTPVGLPYMRSAPDLGAFEMTTLEDHLQGIDIRLGGLVQPHAATFASAKVSLDLDYGPEFSVTVNGDWNDATPVVATNGATGRKTVGLVATLSGTHTHSLAGLPWLGADPSGDMTFAAGDVISLVLVFENGTLVEAQAANRA